jgi:valyl-tRNA synthetase
LMQLLHPYMPFITEEIYHELKERKEGDDLTIRQLNKRDEPNQQLLSAGTLLMKVITTIRDIRVKNQIKPKEKIKLFIEAAQQENYKAAEQVLVKQANAESITYVSSPVPNSISAVVQTDKFYIQAENEIDTTAQKEQLLKDLDYQKGFLLSVEKKLSNERFVQNAKPEVVEVERKKKADAEAKIRAIEESLATL